jgi:hypothetical protein
MSGFNCPGCGIVFAPERGALSRFDNQTKVCSGCGQWEGMVQYTAYSSGLDPKDALIAPGVAKSVNQIRKAAQSE